MTMLSETSTERPRGHQRLLSSAAFSLLSRRHKEVGHADESGSDDSGRPGSLLASDSTPVPSTATAPSHPYRHDPKLSTSSILLNSTTSQQNPPLVATSRSSLGDKGPSIEQSVRKFRIVEALRTGDTKAIVKALRDSQVPDAGSAPSASPACTLDDTTTLHLAIQCAELPVVEFVLSNCSGVDVNARDKDGNTPLHLAAIHGRTPIVRLLLDRTDVNDAIANNLGKLPIDIARGPEIFQQLQLARSLFIDSKIQQIQQLVARGDYEALKTVLEERRLKTWMDVNSPEFVSDPATTETGGTLLHEAARRKNLALIQVLLFHGADPFRRDRRGKLPQDVTKDDATRAMLKKSPAAVAAQRGIQEKAVLGQAAAHTTAVAGLQTVDPVVGKESREIKGFLKKWTNYRRGYQLRWFVLENGVLSYYKHQDDAESVCRGVINMRIGRLHMNADDKTKFEIVGNSSVKYMLKANHEVEAKRWIWALNNSIQWTKDQAREEDRHRARSADLLRQAKAEQSAARGSDAASITAATAASIADGRSERSASFSIAGRTSSDLRRIASSTSAQPIAPPPLPQFRFQPAAENKEHEQAKGDDCTDSPGDDRTDVSEHLSLHRSHSHVLNDSVGSAAMLGDMEAEVNEDNDDDADKCEHDIGTSVVAAAAAASSAVTKDALNITAQTARLQLEFMGQVSAALGAELVRNPTMLLSDARVALAFPTYDAATRTLRGLVGDLVRIARDRDNYWQLRLAQEVEMRQMWEESMARVALEHEELQARVGESEMKRKLTRRALREVIETSAVGDGTVVSSGERGVSGDEDAAAVERHRALILDSIRLTDGDSNEEDEEFFDAVDAGVVEVAEMPPTKANLDASSSFPSERGVAGPSSTAMAQGTEAALIKSETDLAVTAATAASRGGPDLSSSFKGYEGGIRTKLPIDNDNRPKVSLWAILKSMIGKDMTKMTLPVTFNEPTSLLYRCGEDMEYTDLLDLAVGRQDSLERLLYVAAFAASEYASTIGRVAKPFNPLLGETFEYARPDKGYRFFIEQVSHHPPVGAAWAESARWTYYGESAVKSRFYGKSFDINPLGTWFLRLRPLAQADNQAGDKDDEAPEELYTWKKVTSSVVGIISGKPTIDNYGPMEVRNWTTGEVCTIDFKARGWTASSAYQLSGRVLDAQGRARYSLGGRWNSRLYARLLTLGGHDDLAPPGDPDSGAAGAAEGGEKAFLLWQANERPTGIPFNLTPFVLTFNHLDEHLRPWLAPTDSRFRPDQRAMEDGRYDDAGTEKSRLEDAQRARRRAREARGAEFVPAWFVRDTCPITGEDYWRFNGRYWTARETKDWSGLEAIYSDEVD